MDFALPADTILETIGALGGRPPEGADVRQGTVVRMCRRATAHSMAKVPRYFQHARDAVDARAGRPGTR